MKTQDKAIGKNIELNHFFPAILKNLTSVRMRENTDQNNSEYGHFSRSASPKPLQKNTKVNPFVGKTSNFNPIQDGHFRGCSGMEGLKDPQPPI